MKKPEKTVNLGSGELMHPPRLFGLRLNVQQWIKWFFGTNAGVAILVLVLIMLSLLREGSGFLRTYSRELSVYRMAGLEFCDYVKKPLLENQEILSKLKRALNAELNTISKSSRDRRDAALLSKQHVEEKAVLAREALEEALAKEAGLPAPQNTQPGPGRPRSVVSELRKAVTDANAVALESEVIPPIFSADEQKRLQADLLTLQPDQTDPPPFIKEITAAAAARDAEAKEKHAAFVTAVDAFEEAVDPITEVHDSMEATALATKEKAVQRHMAEDAREQLFAAAATAKTEAEKQAFIKDAESTSLENIDYKASIEPLLAKLPQIEKLVPAYREAIQKAFDGVPQKVGDAEANKLISKARSQLSAHIKHLDDSLALMRTWDYSKPVPKFQATMAFLFGGDWITNSSWQDFYGVVPLFTGSLLIAFVAMSIALPFSVGAAIYTNQFATPREQEIIKPTIEFIQAIPSVVLGFIGISVLGDLIKEISQIPFLSWIPGFPVAERLNMFNAGCLLALMAVPTMFSLAEDAINNVPRSFAEASDALGATKLQTVFRVVVPAASSGILAAVLLGLGRIIGETMVVLLVAGNRIAIPDFSDGLGTVFQPAHTLTGIIAQELGEVSRGSSHWQALFMVGILLFFISLLINWLARLMVRRLKTYKV